MTAVAPGRADVTRAARIPELDERRAYDLTKAVMAMNAGAEDAQEGMCAFLEKRPPRWAALS